MVSISATIHLAGLTVRYDSCSSVIRLVTGAVCNRRYVNYGRPMEYGRPLYFHPVVSFYHSIFLFFPRLISAAAHWMSTILPHKVWP